MEVKTEVLKDFANPLVHHSKQQIFADHIILRCIDGYYGNPSSGQPCVPCQCPDVPSSNQYFARSCYQNSWTLEVICNCQEGYTGIHCDECSNGFYGNPRISGECCLPCPCNNNIDRTDPESCSSSTGECLKCLYNTHGPNCQFCKPGYFGSAPTQNCKRCTCNLSGVNRTTCPMGDGACLCDPTTGSCPCLPNVVGLACDQCAEGYWNLVPGKGCQFCECDPENSHSTHCNQENVPSMRDLSFDYFNHVQLFVTLFGILLAKILEQSATSFSSTFYRWGTETNRVQ